MTLRSLFIGSSGPFYYEDTVGYSDEEFEIADPPETVLDGDPVEALRTDGQLRVAKPPGHPEHVTRLGDLLAVVMVLQVTDIDNPTELNSVSGDHQESIIIAYQPGTGADSHTIYCWDTNYVGSPDGKYVVAGSSGGWWVAVAGRNLSGITTTNGQVGIYPLSVSAPLILGANAQSQLVTGLNADLLDGLHASDISLGTHDHDLLYLKLIGGTLTGNLTVGTNLGGNRTLQLNSVGDGNWLKLVTFNSTSGVTARNALTVTSELGYVKFISAQHVWFQAGASQPLYFDFGEKAYFRDADAANAIRFTLDSGTGQLTISPAAVSAPIIVGTNGNGVRCIGLNADLLDGLHASDLAVANHVHTDGLLNYVSKLGDIMSGALSINPSAAAGTLNLSRQEVYSAPVKVGEIAFKANNSLDGGLVAIGGIEGNVIAGDWTGGVTLYGVNNISKYNGVVVDNLGRVTQPNQPTCSAYRSGAQSIANITPTKILFNIERFDIGSRFSTVNSNYVVPSAGIYSVTGNCTFTLNAVGRRGIYLYVNDVMRHQGTIFRPDDLAAVTVTINAIIQCAAGDVIDIRGMQESGGSLALEVTEPNYNNFMLFKLG
jgi:hypothetical protein